MSIPTRVTPGGRAHLKSRNPWCDTAKVLNMAARKPRGRRFADMNACNGLDDDWNLHFPASMKANHFDHIVDERTGRIRECTRREEMRAPATLGTEEMLRYRKRVKRRGRGKWQRVYTVLERQRQARRRFVVICWEIKSRAYAKVPALARRFVASVRRSGWKAYYMTLVNMWGFGRKLKNFREAGGETALLGHGVKLTAARRRELVTYKPWIDAQWGAFAGGLRMEGVHA